MRILINLWLFHKKSVISVALLIILAFISVVFLWRPASEEQTLEEKYEDSCNVDSADYKYHPKPVDAVPEDYIPLSDAEAEGDGKLFYSFRDTELLLQDEMGRTIDKGILYNGILIIQHNGVTYVNRDRHEIALAEAVRRSIAYNRDYSIGERIPMKRNASQYDVIIVSVEGNMITATLKDGSNTGPQDETVSYFSHVKTASGEICREFQLTGDGRIQTTLKDGDMIKEIVLQNPTYQFITRRIVVD